MFLAVYSIQICRCALAVTALVLVFLLNIERTSVLSLAGTTSLAPSITLGDTLTQRVFTFHMAGS